MTTLLSRKTHITLIFLALLMVITRNHQWTAFHHLPDASLAIFFLSGLWFSARWPLIAFMLLATLIDAVVMGTGAVSALCFTPAYALLAPAYATAWLGGRWCATQREYAAPFLLLQRVGVLLMVALLAECFASGGFYFFGGYFAHPTLSGFLPRFIRYFPHTLLTLFTYTGVLLGASHLYKQRVQASSHAL